MNARYVVVSADRVSRSDAKLAVIRTFGVIPADVDVDVVCNAPCFVGVLYVFDRQKIEERVNG